MLKHDSNNKIKLHQSSMVCKTTSIPQEHLHYVYTIVALLVHL